MWPAATPLLLVVLNSASIGLAPASAAKGKHRRPALRVARRRIQDGRSRAAGTQYGSIAGVSADRNRRKSAVLRLGSPCSPSRKLLQASSLQLREDGVDRVGDDLGAPHLPVRRCVKVPKSPTRSRAIWISSRSIISNAIVIR